MGLTCAKADVKTQAPLEETEDAQDRSDELLERWRSGELAHLQNVGDAGVRCGGETRGLDWGVRLGG